MANTTRTRSQYYPLNSFPFSKIKFGLKDCPGDSYKRSCQNGHGNNYITTNLQRTLGKRIWQITQSVYFDTTITTTTKLYNEWYEMRCPHSLLSVGLNCSNVSSGKYREWIEVRVYDVTKNVQAPPGTSGIFLG